MYTKITKTGASGRDDFLTTTWKKRKVHATSQGILNLAITYAIVKVTGLEPLAVFVIAIWNQEESGSRAERGVHVTVKFRLGQG